MENENKQKITLLIPTFNEIVGMKEIMPRIKKEWYDQLIVVDGNSTDGTQDYVEEHGHLLVKQKSSGVRPALDEAFPFIKGDIVITFTPDGNSIPELIPALIAKMREGYDLVIVSRYLGNAVSEDDDFVSGKGNRLFTKLINFFYDGNYTDTLVGFRGYRKNMIAEIGLGSGPKYWFEKYAYTYTSWDFLSSLRCAKRKLKIGEIPGDEPSRIGGKAMVPKFKVASVCGIQLLIEKIINVKK
jgi:glycosyltransferase involved in cell wall biosynthesis